MSMRTFRGDPSIEHTEVSQYKCDNFYLPYSEGGISIKEDSLDIDRRILTENALLSERDTMYREELWPEV